MKKTILKGALAISILSLIGSLFFYACEKDEILPPILDGNELPGDNQIGTDPENENDTLMIEAREFVFPVPKMVGQGVTYYIKPIEYNNACGGFTIEITDELNLEVYDFQHPRVMFEITGTPVWRLDYRLRCATDTTVYSDGFIMGSSTN